MGLDRLSFLVQEKFFAPERNFCGPLMFCAKLVTCAISAQLHRFPLMYTTVAWKKDKLSAVYEKYEHWEPMLPRDVTFESIDTMMSKLSEIVD